MRFAFPVVAVAFSLPFVCNSLRADASEDGKMAFAQQCAMCHKVESGAPAGFGPNLATVAGSKAASTDFSYSPAMKNSNLTWTRGNLDALLANPAKTVPGTTMVISVPDPAKRAAIVSYLMSLKS